MAAALIVGAVVALTVFDRADPRSMHICGARIPLRAGAEQHLYDTYDPDTSRYPVWQVWVSSAEEPVGIESLLDLSGVEYTPIVNVDEDDFREVGSLLVNGTCRVSVNLNTTAQLLPEGDDLAAWTYMLWIVSVRA